MQLFDLTGDSSSGDARCTPPWAAEDRPCPHGHRTGPPFSGGFTFPQDHATGLDYVASFYACIPLMLAIGFPLVFLWTRGTREILAVIYFWLLTLLEYVLKPIFGMPRPPGSCLTSCGMPSGHTLVSVGFFLWLVLEVARSRALSMPVKSLWLFVGGILLVPVGWSRTVTHDHTWAQVIVGGVIAMVAALGWFGLLSLRIRFWFLKLLTATLPFLNGNYPLDGVQEEGAWAAGGSGVPGAAAAAAAAGRPASKPVYGTTDSSFPATK